MQKKVEGQEITMADAPETGGAQVIDLMEALRASLEKKGVQAGRESRAAPARDASRQARAATRSRGAGAAQERAANSASVDAPVRRARRRKLLGLPRSTIRALIERRLRHARSAGRATRGCSRSRT